MANKKQEISLKEIKLKYLNTYYLIAGVDRLMLPDWHQRGTRITV